MTIQNEDTEVILRVHVVSDDHGPFEDSISVGYGNRLSYVFEISECGNFFLIRHSSQGGPTLAVSTRGVTKAQLVNVRA